eukprot:CAMPEP_0203747388 /NCGR_PEP_ID=MMETSP0098-20131031/2556_1 /ASSEMBLY_ACC=CAM_ASM_000208 /TAXON_ID=96639 /ORGANISM=" , Strain NY0313808BC1" /LENGTH=107 /DNA_ID=CAMNT_0050635801 /DNA_START=3782 /DNA_END=4105 /DNA_ORIENTATION=+
MANNCASVTTWPSSYTVPNGTIFFLDLIALAGAFEARVSLDMSRAWQTAAQVGHVESMANSCASWTLSRTWQTAAQVGHCREHGKQVRKLDIVSLSSDAGLLGRSAC